MHRYTLLHLVASLSMQLVAATTLWHAMCFAIDSNCASFGFAPAAGAPSYIAGFRQHSRGFVHVTEQQGSKMLCLTCACRPVELFLTEGLVDCTNQDYHKTTK